METTRTPDGDLVAALLVHLGRAARPAEGEAEALTAAQWAALRYFAQANPPSRTPSAFARFHATSRGTASQTVKALTARGLLARAATGGDGRSVRLDVTAAGEAALAGDPMRRLSAAIAALPEPLRGALATAAARLACAVDIRRGDAPFGVCPDCASCEATAAGCWCSRHGAALGAGDLDRLCADFTPRDAMRETMR